MISIPVDGLLARLREDSSVYPLMLDVVSDRVLLAKIPKERRIEAAFLDQRVLTPDTEGAWCPWDRFAAAAPDEHDGACAYFFHVGHCGSTLLSRLVSSAAGVQPLREPLPLRSLAEEAADALWKSSLLSEGERRNRMRVLERSWARDGGVVVKATSMCCGLIDDVRPDAPIAFVYVKPEIYLALLLGGENTHLDLRSFAKMRGRRLSADIELPTPLSAMSTAELAAMSWLTETVSVGAAARPVQVIDFDAFLAEPATALDELCRHLGWPAEARAIDTAVNGPIMRRYAKAPEHAYDASTRAQILAEDGARYHSEIKSGMQWLENVAKQFAMAEAVLSRLSAA